MPAGVKAELRGLIELQRKAEQTVKDLHGMPMLEAMRDCTLMVQRTAKREAKVDRGHYRASITPSVGVSGNVVEGVVGSNLAHAPFAILDTKPHWPPLEPIRQWVHRKALGGTGSGRGLRRASASVEAGIAFLVARKIAREGTKGDRSLMKGLEQNAVAIVARINRAVNRAVDK